MECQTGRVPRRSAMRAGSDPPAPAARHAGHVALKQSPLMSALETAAGTAAGISIAQGILWLNGVDLGHALTWNAEILAATATARFMLRRTFDRF
jgi:hypothetical protein